MRHRCPCPTRQIRERSRKGEQARHDTDPTPDVAGQTLSGLSNHNPYQSTELEVRLNPKPLCARVVHGGEVTDGRDLTPGVGRSRSDQGFDRRFVSLMAVRSRPIPPTATGSLL